MNSFDQIPIFGYDKGGLTTYYKPLFLENDAFQRLENAYIFRGRVLKRLGNELVGRLARNFEDINYFKVSASPWSFNLLSVSGYVSAANNANPGQITTKYPHNLSNGDTVILTGVLGATGYNNTTFTVTIVDGTNFTIGVNAGAFGAYTSGGFFISNRSLSATEPKAEILCGTVSITLKNGPDIVFTDNGDGTLSSVTAGNSGIINYVTGAITLTHTAAPGVDVEVSYRYAPSLPVMSISQREQAGINDEQTIFFDTKYAYIYSSPYFVEWIPGTIWNSTDKDFFWTENYRGSDARTRLFFETNFLPTLENPMRYTDSTTWTNFQPIVSITGGVNTVIFTARILVSYYGRLLAFNTYEGVDSSGPTVAQNFFNRCRFSQIGSPIAADAWRSDLFGKGGFIDAPTNEEIISVGYIKNTLIVFFEQTTWQLRYVGEYGLPFIWERISSDFGAESTFSPILFNDYVLSIGDKAIVASSATDVQRIDLAIPNFIFDAIKNANNGTERVHGVRDYQKEIVYWCFSNITQDNTTFPGYVLAYNYRNQTFSIFRDNVTCFGTLQRQNNVLWSSTTTYWADEDQTWGNSSGQTGFPMIVKGNNQGFIHYFGYVTPDEPSLTVRAINRATTPPTITSLNHNLNTGDIIKLTDLNFINGSSVVATDLNDKYYSIQYINADSFYIYQWNDTSQTFNDDFTYTPANGTGTYVGCGKITLFPRMLIQTKDFSPYQKQGLQTKASYFDFLNDVPESNTNNLIAYTVVANINSSPAAVANVITGNKQLETTTPIPYYVPASQYAWHRFFCTLNGQFFSLTMTYDDSLMASDATHENSWGLYAITLYCRPAGRNVF